MAFALAQTAVGVHATTGALTATLGAAPTPGNVLVAIVGDNISSNAGFPAMPAGWSVLQAAGNSGSATGLVAWWKIAGASEPASLSVTPSNGSSYDLHLAEFSGFTAPVLDKAGTANSAAATVTTLAPATPALDGSGDFLIAAVFLSAAVTAPSYGTGWTQVVTSSRMLSSFSTAASQAAQTETFNWTTAVKAYGFIAAISPAALTAAWQGWGNPV